MALRNSASMCCVGERERTHLHLAVLHDLVGVVVVAEDEAVDVGDEDGFHGEGGNGGEEGGNGRWSEVHGDGEDVSVQMRVEGVVENVAVTTMTSGKQNDKTSTSLTRLRMRTLGNALAMVYT